MKQSWGSKFPHMEAIACPHAKIQKWKSFSVSSLSQKLGPKHPSFSFLSSFLQLSFWDSSSKSNILDSWPYFLEIHYFSLISFSFHTISSYVEECNHSQSFVSHSESLMSRVLSLDVYSVSTTQILLVLEFPRVEVLMDY